MRVLIAGGTGFLGTILCSQLSAAGHEITILSRSRNERVHHLHWDGSQSNALSAAIGGFDVVINACGYGLQHWPWTAARQRRFIDSRVEPGRALAAAFHHTDRPPGVFIQFSGASHYGTADPLPADEDTPPGKDFQALITASAEAATASVEGLGVRRIVLRNGIVLHPKGGLFPLFSLACRLFFGGRFGTGRQFIPWIDARDHTAAIQFLLGSEEAEGAYNLVAPGAITNEEFMRIVCRALRRPYWFHVPAGVFRAVLGRMSVLVLEGRQCRPRRLLESGFTFAYPSLDVALQPPFWQERPGIRMEGGR